jgi:hypothetical protein
MKLVSMKLSAKEAKEDCGMTAPGDTKDLPRWPWGLRLTLDDEVLTKLGLELPDVGDTVTITAQAHVVSVNSSERQGETNRSVELQITDLAIGAESRPDDAKTAKALYDNTAE